ncbi:MAG TPA: glycosyltransferase family A protein, partial [Novosphingobium sp.]|nr:glycosyltransferase family A protein [Novosphingobium sp.]
MNGGLLRVDLAVCTYRRWSLMECLESIAAQDMRRLVDLRVIVADNNESPMMAEAVAHAARDLALPITYVHAPAKNISVARNACLDAAEGDWLLFIDDDEAARPNWLARLLARREEADVIFGVSEALMGAGAPGWMRSGAFHSNRFNGNDKPHNGYTCNVAMRRAAIAGLRFAPELGTVGGEDTLFFHEAMRRGLRFAYAPDAVVTEHIPDHRATLGWLLRRRFRSGQTHQMLLAREGRRAITVVPVAVFKVACCLLAALANGFSRERAAAFLAR